jgi:hypothetical protein
VNGKYSLMEEDNGLICRNLVQSMVVSQSETSKLSATRPVIALFWQLAPGSADPICQR